MRSNKHFLFGAMGFAGGAAGAVAGEIVPEFASSPVLLVLHVTIWSAVCAALITVGLFAAGEIYNRRPLSSAILRKALIGGAIAGAVAGAIAQAVYSVQPAPSLFKHVILRLFCWGLMGAILGWRLAAVVPNLGMTRGVTAGALGGAVGGIGFLVAGSVIPQAFGRMFGLGILGATLGLAIVWAEAFFREASIEITWAPKETTSVTLGPHPVYIGGGDDHVYVAGLPEHAAELVHENGKIQYIESAI